jgi:excinuclease UvrABC helicase subunit UvrB
MNKLTNSSSNNDNKNDNTWEEIKQRLDNGASIRNIAFEYNDYCNVNKSKICNYFYEVLVAREEKIKENTKEKKKSKTINQSQTAEEVQNFFDELKQYYDI